MNRVDLVGRLTRDPELRFTQKNGTAVARVTIAVDDYDFSTQQKTAQFIPITVWGKSAERLVQYTSKGSLISVVGKLRAYSYDAKDGSKRYGFEVVADSNGGIRFLSKSNNHNNSNYNNQYDNTQYNNQHNNNQYNNNQYNNQNNYTNQHNDYNNSNFSFQDEQFANAFGGFGNDLIPVDDSDMPF